MKRFNFPVNKTVNKILVGKLFTFHSKNIIFVILGVRRNSLYGYLEILIGRIYPSKHTESGYTNAINVYSWYGYNPKNDMTFVGRSNKAAIRNCLKRNPMYIKYHLGKSVDISKFKIYDEHNVYEDYKKSINY